jgi:hypothetical protein
VPNSETVLKLLKTESVVYRRPLNPALNIVLSNTDLAIVSGEIANGEFKVLEKRILWNSSSGLKAVINGSEALNFLLNWNRIFSERFWEKSAPSLEEVVRVINTYATGAGYRLFTVSEGDSLAGAVRYEIEIAEMHEISGWDS